MRVPAILASLVPRASVQDGARAVQAQAQVTGAAANASLQCTLQTERDRALEQRQRKLLGRKLAVDATQALTPAHTATGEDDHAPSEPRDYLQRRRKDERHKGR